MNYTRFTLHIDEYTYADYFHFIYIYSTFAIRYIITFFPKATTGLEPIGYRGALLSSLLLVSVYDTQFAECTSTDCK
jgi:hypothetical protein